MDHRRVTHMGDTNNSDRSRTTLSITRDTHPPLSHVTQQFIHYTDYCCYYSINKHQFHQTGSY